MKPLSDKQIAFVTEYVLDVNATQAAIRAGYSKRTAYSQGQRLLKNVEVARKIADYQKQSAKRNQVTLGEITEMHRTAYSLAKENKNPSVMTQSAQNLAKLHGLIVDRKETKVGADTRAIRTLADFYKCGQ